MPSISRFFGITIYMYYAHGQHKAPYFHARYGSADGSFLVENGHMVAGELPPRAARLVQEWAERHKAELLENWTRVKAGEMPKEILGADHD